MKIEINDGSDTKKPSAKAASVSKKDTPPPSKKSIVVTVEPSEARIPIADPADTTLPEEELTDEIQPEPALLAPDAIRFAPTETVRQKPRMPAMRMPRSRVPKVSMATRVIILLASVSLAVIGIEGILGEIDNKTWNFFLTPFNIVIILVGVFLTFQYLLPKRGYK
jgi:hypothetical protein